MNKFESFSEERRFRIERIKTIEELLPQLHRELEEHKRELLLPKWEKEEVRQSIPVWTGQEELRGRVRWSDKEKWVAILQVGLYEFVLVNVNALMETNRSAAIKLAQTFAQNKFPRSGFSFGTVIISISGEVEFKPTTDMLSLPSSYERKRSDLMQG